MEKLREFMPDDRIKDELENESICEQCGRGMKLTKIRSKKNRWDKGHSMYDCVCGNQLRKRTFNETLRDLGERE